MVIGAACFFFFSLAFSFLSLVEGSFFFLFLQKEHVEVSLFFLSALSFLVMEELWPL